MKNFVSFLQYAGFLFLTTCVFSSANAQSGGWTLLKSENNVSFYVKAATCNSDSVLLVRISNSGQQQVKVSWNLWGTTVIHSSIVIPSGDIQGVCMASGGGGAPSILVNAVPAGKSATNPEPTVTIE